MHAGEVQAPVDRDDGPLLLPDDAGGHPGRHRHLLGVQREQPDGAHRGGRPQLGRGGDPDLHGSRRPSRRGLHEPQGAEPGEAPARHQRVHARRRRPHVHARQVGLVSSQVLFSLLVCVTVRWITSKLQQKEKLRSQSQPEEEEQDERKKSDHTFFLLPKFLCCCNGSKRQVVWITSRQYYC